MPSPHRLSRDRFPRASRYHPDWVAANCMGANSLWLAEWLLPALDLRPGQRLLDLGCGKAATSIFLARECDVQVWATDLWVAATENLQRIRDAGLEGRVFPLHADARALPFAGDFFDAITCIDAFYYFGTDDLYLNYLAHFLKPGGQLAVAGAGLTREIPDSGVPGQLRGFWGQDAWCLHSAEWLRRHWSRTGIVDVELADAMPDGWEVWLDWHRTVHAHNAAEIAALEADRGQHLGYTRAVARRRAGVKLEDYCWPDTMKTMPSRYEPMRLLWDEGGSAPA